MIVQADRSIERLDRGERPTLRSLNDLQRKAKQNSNFLRAFRPELVLVCGTAGLPQANAPPQKLHSGRETSAPPCCIPSATQCSEEKPRHTIHLEGIVRAQWESGRWVAAPQGWLSVQFCRHLLTVFRIDPCHFPAGVDVDSL